MVLSNAERREKFVKEALLKHGSKYDYSLVQFGPGISKVAIKCPYHGIFYQKPHKHVMGSGCKQCRRMNTEQFVEKAKKLYGEDHYDYSNTVYVKSNLKVKIRCKKHDYLFESIPNNHLRNYGCYKCGLERIGAKRRKTTQDFVERSKKVHGNRYDYSLTDYQSSDKKVKIICPKHGEFFQTPSSHLYGKGCPICGKWSLSNTQEFIKKALKVHGNLYDYSFVDYKNSRTPVKIKCLKHGIFEQIPNIHLHGCGCPTCLESRGEKKIAKFLTENRIKFEREKSFDGCKDKNKLLFDFYIPKLNICIEYDGLQHFTPVSYFGGDKVFEQTQKSDLIKADFCKTNKIKLIRIPYKKRTEMSSILKKEIIESYGLCR